MNEISPSQKASIDQYNRWQDDKEAYMARNHPETLIPANPTQPDAS